MTHETDDKTGDDDEDKEDSSCSFCKNNRNSLYFNARAKSTGKKHGKFAKLHARAKSTGKKHVQIR